MHAPDAVRSRRGSIGAGPDPFLYIGDNVRNGTNLLEAAVRHGVRRFILSSTANLFDQPQRIPIAEIN